MADDFPRLYADERGVWREDKPGHPFGLLWNEITGVGGYKLDGITEVYTVVELDHPSGHWLELSADMPGFAEVAQALSTQLPDLRVGWLAEIERLVPRQAPISVWRRAEPGNSGT